MSVAEALYQRGIISYPRTETEKFKREFNIKYDGFSLDPSVFCFCRVILPHLQDTCLLNT